VQVDGRLGNFGSFSVQLVRLFHQLGSDRSLSTSLRSKNVGNWENKAEGTSKLWFSLGTKQI
jgi:hypothetical protein